PFFTQASEVKRVGLVLMTADRGLCGSFNVNLINTAVKFIREKEAQGIEVSLVCVGRKGRDFFRRRKREMLAEYADVWNKFDFSNAVTVARELMSAFLTGSVQEVYLIYSSFINMAIQRPRMVQLLPIQSAEAAAEAPSLEYLFEPPMEQFLEYLLPKYINVQVYHGFLENSASEYAARMTAMDNAQSNCKEMITSLTLVMNKARQAAITRELMDIVGGAEALKG
ncbi:MAG TPA: ATP synthase F1 subunit gamma, partial [Desulfobaccales bacterium]